GDLECQVARIEAAGPKRLLYVLADLVTVELARGDVYGDPDRMSLRVPEGSLAAGLEQDPAADVRDHAGLLQQGDERVGLDESAGRTLPPDQRLHPGRRHVAEVESRLEDEEELALGEGSAKVALELHPVLEPLGHARLEDH